jgi:hypothetical protein
MVDPLSQRGRNKIVKIRPDDREALSSKTELKCRESCSQEIKRWARPRIEL